ncbi:MAG: hypothetical protein AAB544_01160 [Patescibacteria group bacterium]
MNEGSDHLALIQQHLAAAEKAIREFRAEEHDVMQPMVTCADMYITCCSLFSTYHAFLVLNDGIVDQDIHRKVQRTLELAGKTIPGNNIKLQRVIGEWIGDIAAIEMELCDNQDSDT